MLGKGRQGLKLTEWEFRLLVKVDKGVRYLNVCSDCWVKVHRICSCLNGRSVCCVKVDRDYNCLNVCLDCWVNLGRGCSSRFGGSECREK